MIAYIYTLRKYNSNDIFYVGATKSLKQRLTEHQTSYKQKLIIEILEEVKFTKKKDLVICENFWIEQFRQWGFKLENIVPIQKQKRGKKIDCKYVPLRNVPKHISDIISKAKCYAGLFENIELTRKEDVVYRIIEEWYEMKKPVIEAKRIIYNSYGY